MDVFVARTLGVSRAEVQRWIAAGAVTIDGKVARAKDVLAVGATLDVTALPARESELVPDASVPFEILHEDDSVIVVVKPPGVVVHPARGNEEHTLVHGLLSHGLATSEDRSRPGIVHRLDKGTSGVMVVAKTSAAREALREQFTAHTIERAYDGICVGEVVGGTVRTMHGRHPTDRMKFTSRVELLRGRGKLAVTHVEVREKLRGATLVSCTLETGRTHQIRVHLADAGTPVLGDPLYGKTPRDRLVRAAGEKLGHQALHACVLGFVHPKTKRKVRFEAVVPPDFVEALEALR